VLADGPKDFLAAIVDAGVRDLVHTRAEGSLRCRANDRPHGMEVCARNRRIVAMIGDGSFQLTAQEVAGMIRRKLPVIIFLMNNHGYTIEVEIHDGPYNNIKN